MTRLRHLKQTNPSVRFLSFEPLIGPISEVDLENIHWVIAGGESGPGARPVKAEWLRELRDQCQRQCVPFFFKQWGGRTPKAGGNTLSGRQYVVAVPDPALQYPQLVIAIEKVGAAYPHSTGRLSTELLKYMGR